MKLQTTLLGKTYQFKDLKDVLAKANEEKTGDKLAGLAAQTAQERVAAKVVLSAVLLSDLREHPAVPYEKDEVTRIIQDDVNEKQYEKIRNWTVSDLREWILDENTTGADIRKLSRGLTSEMVAALNPKAALPASLPAILWKIRSQGAPSRTAFIWAVTWARTQIWVGISQCSLIS